jgi:hypothetical protein
MQSPMKGGNGNMSAYGENPEYGISPYTAGKSVNMNHTGVTVGGRDASSPLR